MEVIVSNKTTYSFEKKSRSIDVYIHMHKYTLIKVFSVIQTHCPQLHHHYINLKNPVYHRKPINLTDPTYVTQKYV